MRIWYCKIGEVDQAVIRPISGADGLMRQAVEREYRMLTGFAPKFIFSGWGAELDESQRAVVENRLPDPYKLRAELLARLEPIERQIELLETPVAEGA